MCGVTDRKVKDCYYVSTDQIAEIRDLTSYQATENKKKANELTFVGLMPELTILRTTDNLVSFNKLNIEKINSKKVNSWKGLVCLHDLIYHITFSYNPEVIKLYVL